MDAERSLDWASAYSHFAEAVSLDPRNLDARRHRENARSRLVQQHFDTAERAALDGNFAAAESELLVAARLDPAYKPARERLAQIETLAHGQQSTVPLAGPVQLKPQPGTRNFNFRGDARGCWQEVARQFGLIVEFDGALNPVQVIRFRVPAVDFAAAADTLSAATHTFWIALDERTIFITEDSPANRARFAPEVTRTFPLPASVADADLTDTVRAVREIAGITKTTLNAATREITVRDTPEKVALADAIVKEIEQQHGELVLEIELLEVNRAAALQLGVNLPTSVNVVSVNSQEIAAAQQAQNQQQLLAVIQQVFGSSTTFTGIPPLVAFGGGKTTFFSTLGNGQANFSQTLNLVQSAKRMLLRAEDNQPASFFIGTHFPITLSLLSPDIAAVASSILTNPTRTDLTTGTAPSAVAVGSFHSPSAQDLVVANQTDNTISIFPGNGDGTFGTRTDINVGAAPVALLSGDFNGDGKTDIAVVNQTDASVTILLGNGDGTFNPAPLLKTDTGPSAIISGDFNGDGFLDLAVANEAAGTVSIFAGNGDGTFKTPTTLAVSGGPHALAAADLNGDGRLDLAVVNRTAGTVAIFLGNGDGTFIRQADVTVGGTPSGIVVEDLNADGRLDLAVSNSGTSTVSVFLGNGDGTFSAATQFATGQTPQAIVAADFNGDGFTDLVTADQGSNTVSVLLGGGNGTFQTPLELNVASGPVALVTGDFNFDTRADLAVAASAANAVTVLINTIGLTQATSVPQVPYPGSEYEDIGLKVQTTPHVHPNDEVTLQLSFDISSLSGQSVNGIPIITNRSIQQTVRLRENEMSVLSGILDHEENRSIAGAPAFPYSANNTNTDNELIILITPRLVRLGPHGGRTIYAGRGDISTAGPRQ
ncbi:MAG TPA: FG-GAP-like repeat-containing protein [Candidatus Acidoferrales bacterium]|nr:FG-GAP-like repeat-containing protein [Candidatus Acidoferrales bacterium]